MASWQSRFANSILKVRVGRRKRKSLDQLRSEFESLLTVSAEELQSKFPGVSIEAGEFAGVPCERSRTSQSKSKGVILYFHGGGYVMGSVATHRRMALRLAWAAQCEILTFDYRLAPEHPFPAALDDSISVYQALLAKSPPVRILFGGDSAGGGLLLATLFRIRELGLPLPRASFLISPWANQLLDQASIRANRFSESILDLSMLRKWSEWYRGETPREHPMISPALGSFEHLPPMLIQVSSHEMLLDDARAVEHCARRDGVEVTLEVWPRMPHTWHLFSHWIPEGKQALEKIGKFISLHLNSED